MSWYEFLLFVHVTAAVIWLGGAFTFQMYALLVRRGGDADEMAQFAGRTGWLAERAAALVLAVLTALFLAPLRGGVAEAPAAVAAE